MNKRILCLCFVLIALIGISGVSACYADNSTVVDSNLGLSLTDSVQSVDDGVELLNDQALEEMDDIDSKSEVVDDLNEDVSQDNCISIPNEDNDSLDSVDESAIDLKDNGFIINAAKDEKNNFSKNFLPILMNKNLLVLDFDLETGILKVNQNCSYMNTTYMNSSAPVKWHILLDNNPYLKGDSKGNNRVMWQMGEGHRNRIGDTFNVSDYIVGMNLPAYGDGIYKCIISIDVLRDKAVGIDFSVDFEFSVVVDNHGNIVTYRPLEKSIVHVYGKDFTVFNSKDPKFLLYGSAQYLPTVKKIISAQKDAYRIDMARYLYTVMRSFDLATINNLSNTTLS